MRLGATTKLTHALGSVRCQNASSASEHGELVSDAVGAWIQEGFVAGPYDHEPFAGFRVNPIMAVPQKQKVRPVMNLSSPKSQSFNDFVDEKALKKLTMSTAALFGEDLFRCGKNAIFAKVDFCDAFKQVGSHPSQWKLFGFCWLGRFFYDLTTVFGAKSAPQNFDFLAEVLVNITKTLLGVSSRFVHRTLDDVVTVAKAGSDFPQRFCDMFNWLCQKIGLPLAEKCSLREKAFGPGTEGTVLGVRFDSKTLTWSLPEEKAESMIEKIASFQAKKVCTLKEAQELHGKLNYFAQICIFMKGYRYHLIKLLGSFKDADKSEVVTQALKKDLVVWKGAIFSALHGMPLPYPECNKPVSAITFKSGAAGSHFEWLNGVCRNQTKKGDRGTCSLLCTKEAVSFCKILRWPYRLLHKESDSKGKPFGKKLACLEMIGILIPVFELPEVLRYKHVNFETENLSVVYCWKKKYCKYDEELSILLQVMHVLESLLECKFYVSHVKSMSTEESKLVKRLTRRETTTICDRRTIRNLNVNVSKNPLTMWLEDPVIDWGLPEKCMNFVSGKI